MGRRNDVGVPAVELHSVEETNFRPSLSRVSNHASKALELRAKLFNNMPLPLHTGRSWSRSPSNFAEDGTEGERNESDSQISTCRKQSEPSLTEDWDREKALESQRTLKERIVRQMSGQEGPTTGRKMSGSKHHVFEFDSPKSSQRNNDWSGRVAQDESTSGP